MCVCVCVCVHVRACVGVYVCACMHVSNSVCVWMYTMLLLVLQKGLYRRDSPLHMLITSYQLVSIN